MTILAAAGLPNVARQLLDGSFTTAKAEPGDLDLAVEVPLAGPELEGEQEGLRPSLLLLAGPETRAAYRCDAYPILVLPRDHPLHEAVTARAIRYWTRWFGRDRDGRAKGRVWATVGGFRR